jgi:hypothetical protein
VVLWLLVALICSLSLLLVAPIRRRARPGRAVEAG